VRWTGRVGRRPTHGTVQLVAGGAVVDVHANRGRYGVADRQSLAVATPTTSRTHAAAALLRRRPQSTGRRRERTCARRPAQRQSRVTTDCCVPQDDGIPSTPMVRNGRPPSSSVTVPRRSADTQPTSTFTRGRRVRRTPPPAGRPEPCRVSARRATACGGRCCDRNTPRRHPDRLIGSLGVVEAPSNSWPRLPPGEW
jgi:hypothetical protein